MCRVLLPTDFSEATWLVTRAALSYVDALGGELLLLHVVPDLYLCWLDHLAMTFIDQTRLEAAYDELRAEGHRQFSTWLPASAHERCRTLVAVGETADTILKVAQAEMAEMILMRAPIRRWWRPRLTGSVTDTVRCRASVPVVVWGGLGKKVSRGMWQDARRPPERGPLQPGAWRERGREPWEPTPVLKSR
jgi:nucleotide-binding universal stress UspA family protein